MSEKEFYISIEQLREAYERKRRHIPPRRARGIPWGLAMLLFQIPLSTLAAMGLSKIADLDFGGALVLAFFLLFPCMQQLLDWRIKTVRYSFRHYPRLKRTIQQLNETDSRFLKWLPVLRINGKDMFLVHYGNRRKEFNGWALLDGEGYFIHSPELLEKAYKTFILANLGGDDINLSFSDNQRYGWGLHTVRRILPKVEKILRKQEKEFEQYGLSLQWHILIRSLPSLVEAMQVGLQIYETNNRWRSALGWNAGKIYLYEDAEEYLRMCLAYSQYMAAAYGNTLVEIITTANQLMYTVNAEADWRGRKKATWALSMLVAAAKGVESWIFTYGVLGKVTEKEMSWYRRKLNRAMEVGLPIVQE
ncbi:MAG: hypothetical protein ACK8QZ_02660 [Anaerolineales bacterium]